MTVRTLLSLLEALDDLLPEESKSSSDSSPISVFFVLSDDFLVEVFFENSLEDFLLSSSKSWMVSE